MFSLSASRNSCDSCFKYPATKLKHKDELIRVDFVSAADYPGRPVFTNGDKLKSVGHTAVDTVDLEIDSQYSSPTSPTHPALGASRPFMNKRERSLGVLLSVFVLILMAAFLSSGHSVQSQSVRAVPSPTPLSGEDLFWSEAVKADTVEMFELYLKEYHSGRYVREAKKIIEELKKRTEVNAWRKAQSLNTLDSYRTYLDEYPFGAFINEAMSRVRVIQKQRETAMWTSTEQSKTEKAYRDYLEAFPYGEYAAVARLRLRTLGATNIPVVVRKNSLGMEFAWIPPGEFLMGSSSKELGRESNEGPQRFVVISNGFWMGRYEVTQGQYTSVMAANPSSFNECGADCPVENIDWTDAKAFLEKLNRLNDDFVYSLPSEAEWEYAARAGTAVGRPSELGNVAWYSKNSGLGPRRIGLKRPNAWGLHDMLGNVAEWVEDVYSDTYRNLPRDGSANLTVGDLTLRVFRGFSWGDPATTVRFASRWAYPGCSEGLCSYGFRVVARER